MKNILVIDDDEFVRATISSILQDHGYIVETAEDGEAGMSRVDAFSPQLVLTDIIMPVKEGLSVIIDLRRKGYKGRIIAMSGGGRLGHRDVLLMALRLGADESLAKPFLASELLSKVSNSMPALGENRGDQWIVD